MPRRITPTTRGGTRQSFQLTSLDANSLNTLNQTIQEILRRLTSISLGNAVSGQKSGNLDAQFLRVIFGGADTEVVVPHGLSRIPQGYFVVRSDRACNVYDSSTTAWSRGSLFLRCDTASADVVLLVF